jgi:hypothetical protein
MTEVKKGKYFPKNAISLLWNFMVYFGHGTFDKPIMK